MMRPTTTAGPDRLLLGSAERTVFRTEGEGGAEVRKLLLRGSLADAEREVAIGRSLRGLDVVAHLGAEVDAATNRPCVRTQWLPGEDLAAIVGARGALPAAEACRILLPIARTLAAMHAMRTRELPHGVCHGDVKPANLLHDGDRTVLIDFEHAAPTGTGVATGTPGFAAPEAAQRPALQPAFDVFGLGATLRWLLAGGAMRGGDLELQDPELAMLVAACTAGAAAARPDAAIVAEALADLAARLRQDADAGAGCERALAALQAAEFAACRDAIAAAAPGPRRAAIEERLARRERLWTRSGARIAAALATSPEDAAPGELAVALHRLAAILRRFPRHAGALDLRSRLTDAVAQRLAEQLPRALELVREDEVAAARRHLRDLIAMTTAAVAVPLPFRVPADEDPRLPSLLQRSPLQCLRLEEQRLEAAIAEHDRLVDEVTAAEAALAFDAAEAALDRIAARHGGASTAVARRRDRLHRLAFYVERIGNARRNVDLLGELLPDVDLQALRRLVQDCARAASSSRVVEDTAAGAMGLRNLQFALHNLGEEYPSLVARTGEARLALDAALAAASAECERLLDDATVKLRGEPVPLRPLQTILSRLDTYRSLEAIVDRQGAPRSEVIDAIETLRLRLEQARATRDRLARGAEQALARGHWTTGLFDMERAVTSVEDADEDGATETQRLQQRLAEARRRKQEIEATQRRNVELQARHAALQDDPDSSFAMRLQALSDRHDCLQFLILHAPKERGRLYARDLREVEILLALERSEQAQIQFDAQPDPARRVELAREALAQLDEFAATFDRADLPGRLRRPMDHWRTSMADAERQHADVLHASRRSRRRRLGAVLAGALLCAAGALFGAEFLARGTSAGERTTADANARSFEALRADPASALAALRERAGDDAARRAAASAAAQLVESAAAPPSDLERAHARLVEAVSNPGLDATFAADCLRTALVLTAARCDADALATLRRVAIDAAAALRARGIDVGPEAMRELDRER